MQDAPARDGEWPDSRGELPPPEQQRAIGNRDTLRWHLRMSVLGVVLTALLVSSSPL